MNNQLKLKPLSTKEKAPSVCLQDGHQMAHIYHPWTKQTALWLGQHWASITNCCSS